MSGSLAEMPVHQATNERSHMIFVITNHALYWLEGKRSKAVGLRRMFVRGAMVI
jgi:hypothetical protein